MAGVLEKISEAMQQNEEKKYGFWKSILVLMMEWKNYEGHLVRTATCLQQCCNELVAKEKHLTSVQESVAGSLKDLDLITESIERSRVEVETKEKDFRALRVREMRDLECKWNRFGVAQQGFDEVVKLREEKLNEQEKMVQRHLGEAQLAHKQLENLDKALGDRLREISVKEKALEQRSEELKKIQRATHEETDALHLKEREFSKRVQEFEMKEKSLHKEMETEGRVSDCVRKELKLKESSLIMVEQKLRMKETNLDSLTKKLQEKEHNLVSIQKELSELGAYFEEIEMKETVFHKEIETGGVLDSVRREKENSLIMVNEELRVEETKSYSLEKKHNVDSILNRLWEQESYFGSVNKELKEKASSMMKTFGNTDELVNNVAADKVSVIICDSVKHRAVQLEECNQLLTRYKADGTTSAKAQKPQHTQVTSTGPFAVHEVRPFQSFHSLAYLRKKIAKLQQLIAASNIQNQQPMTKNVLRRVL